MNTLARVLLLLCGGLTLTCAGAPAAGLNVPDPSKSTVPSRFFAVEGSTAGLPDLCSDGRCADFTVTVRDFAGQVIAGSTVVIDYSGCPDIQIACDQLNASTGQTFLAGKKVAGTTNASGQFVFKVQGAANATTPAPNLSPGTAAGVACAQVYADGVPLTPSLVVAAYDVNGLGSPSTAVNDLDLKLVQAECLRGLLGAAPRARDDYNRNGTVTGSDVAISAMMVLDQVAGTGSQKTMPFCP